MASPSFPKPRPNPGEFRTVTLRFIPHLELLVELYEALTKAGVDEETAKQAAKAVLDTEIVATKKDLAEKRTEIIKWNTGTLLAATGIFAVIVKLMA